MKSIPVRFFFLFLALILSTTACEEIDPDKVKEGLEDLNRDFLPVKFNRNLDPEANSQMEQMLSEGIAVFAIHPEGGWVIVTHEGNKFARNIPEECNTQLEKFLADGDTIRSIAFPAQGGNRWVIVTDRDKFARNIPQECSDKLDQYLGAGKEVLHVAFSQRNATDEGWVIVHEDGFFARNIDDECYQIMRNLYEGSGVDAAPERPIHFVAFEPGGGWAVLARDYFFTRNIDQTCFDQMARFQGERREIGILVFDPDGEGWSVICNDQFRARPIDGPIERFEANVSGQSIWDRMRHNEVPGLSVAVVIDNQLAWSTAYGHLAEGQEHAVHPESIFQAASISKPVTAIGIHKLIDQNLIALGDDIQDDLSVTIPSRACYTANPPLILQDVLMHTSPVMGRSSTFPVDSCRNFSLNRGGGFVGYPPGATIPTLNQLIAGDNHGTDVPFTLVKNRGTFHYSGAGYTLLEKLLEDLTKESFATWMKREVLNPLGMDDSYFQLSLPQRYFDAHQVAAGHDTLGVKLAGDRYRYPQFGAAGLYSTSEDLAQVLIMLNDNGRSASGNTVLSQTARNNLALNGIGLYTGSGRSTAGNNYYFHGGTNEGFRCEMQGFPGLGTGVVVMTNGDARMGVSFRQEILQAVIDVYGW